MLLWAHGSVRMQCYLDQSKSSFGKAINRPSTLPVRGRSSAYQHSDVAFASYFTGREEAPGFVGARDG